MFPVTATQELVPVTAKVTITATVKVPVSKDLYHKTTAPPLPEALAPAPPPKNMVPLVNDPEYLKNMVHQAQGMVFPKNMVHHQQEDYRKSMGLRLLEV